tara:strand:+ start:292 stop:456 length:165 start_codon:yes stop_codon:yes gene_type:complete
VVERFNQIAIYAPSQNQKALNIEKDFSSLATLCMLNPTAENANIIVLMTAATIY